MKKYNISKPTVYTDREGNERTFWQSVGTMIEFEKGDGSISRIIEIPAIGLKANVFPMRIKEKITTEVKPKPAEDDLPEINPDDLPF